MAWYDALDEEVADEQRAYDAFVEAEQAKERDKAFAEAMTDAYEEEQAAEAEEYKALLVRLSADINAYGFKMERTATWPERPVMTMPTTVQWTSGGSINTASTNTITFYRGNTPVTQSTESVLQSTIKQQELEIAKLKDKLAEIAERSARALNALGAALQNYNEGKTQAAQGRVSNAHTILTGINDMARN